MSAPSPPPASVPGPDALRRYWRRTVRVTLVLLAVWFVVTFVVGFYARELNVAFFGWPFSYWVGAQGALLVYVGLIAFYAWYMNRLDAQHGVADTDA
ncbi:putative solute:sodium symporter small subunit [Tepidimonas thermarum]|uniref:Putative solute:sodium symporter small subunit n=1 Tax=Tepidimonas thermarum TaxID=335431 RepID=A0A554X2T1_9BURK|nr:DUF4212 domain-containing protein [Tepidimonas thermarum]TSE30149.1 putative solute:sodium symporter small subunit [Tepidimonas thermarum]